MNSPLLIQDENQSARHLNHNSQQPMIFLGTSIMYRCNGLEQFQSAYSSGFF